MDADLFQFISIIATLRLLLQNVQVRNQILNPLPEIETEGHLTTFQDGIQYKEHEEFSKFKTSLEILLYSDEFEVLNPLGPPKKKLKLLTFYFNWVICIKLVKLKHLQCFWWQCANVRACKKHGFTSIAAVVNNKLRLLETEGIVVEDYPDTISAALAFIAGDNLNINMLGDLTPSRQVCVTHVVSAQRQKLHFKKLTMLIV